MAYTTVIFDMDGTILDTLADLTASLDRALAECGHAHDFGRGDVGRFFGSGAEVAVTRALAVEAGLAPGAGSLEAIGRDVDAAGLGLDPAEVERVRSAFARVYAGHCNDSTRPYPGIPGLLESLSEAGLHRAVVSNKMDPEVRRLADLHFPGLLDVSVGEQPGVRRKPAPDAVLRVMELLGVGADEVAYVGDSEIDLLTAENAGLDCIAVTWGFRTRAFLESHGAAPIADDANELAALILG